MINIKLYYKSTIGIIAHLLLILYSIIIISKIKSIHTSKLFLTENIFFILGHLFIIINLIKSLKKYYKTEQKEKTIYDILKNYSQNSNNTNNSNNNNSNDNDNNDKVIYHSIGHLFLFLFGILLTITEYNKISALNNKFNIIYTLNQLSFTILLFLLNYNKISYNETKIANFTIIIIFIIFIIYKINISYETNNKFLNLVPLYAIIIYLILIHSDFLEYS